jgi:PTS system mannose-specific IIB component/fructoselysine and glucoselysine-specific PTS system IIB component
VSIELYRIDDRLIHGQVVVGWGHPMELALIALVDDAIAASPWEQELYRLAVPEEIEVVFASVDEAARMHAQWAADPRHAILLTATVAAMCRLAGLVPAIRAVNLGGVHQGAGRTERLRYLYLTPDEEKSLAALAVRGVEVTARDVPTASALPLRDVLAGRGAA